MNKDREKGEGGRGMAKVGDRWVEMDWDGKDG